MDGLDEFEKSLAADKAEREKVAREDHARRERRHHHKHDRPIHRNRSSDRGKDHHEKRHHPHRTHGENDDGRHRHKRSRHSRQDEDAPARDHRRDDDRRGEVSSEDDQRDQKHDRETSTAKDTKDLKDSDAHLDLPLPDDEEAPQGRGEKTAARDAWMTAPSALDVDYVHRKDKNQSRPAQKTEPPRVLHKRELNGGLLNQSTIAISEGRTVDYTFGDDGSQWRMTKLKAVYKMAKETGRSVDELGAERFGSLEEFDDAREEEIEMERFKTYGKGYIGKEKPTGELFRERQIHPGRPERDEMIEVNTALPLDDATASKSTPPASRTVDQSALNRLRAQLMKARLRGGADVARMEAEYEAANAGLMQPGQANDPVVIDVMHSRMLAGPRGEVQAIQTRRGRERGQVTQKEDMSVEDMVREERRTRGQAGGEGMRLAERIAKDGKFDDDLDYMDENAEKLATRVHKTEAVLKNAAVSEYQKINKILDKCPLCHHEDRAPPQDLPIAPLAALATRVFLTLATEPELNGAEGGAVIAPISHHQNLLECDDDEWEEIRNFMKSLTRLYHEQGRDVLFYENAAAPHRHLHAALVAVPIPYEMGETAPAFFREAMLSADEEWSQHKKIIDTDKRAREGLGKLAFRRSLAKEMPYFHVWFGLDGGLGHIVEDAERWPRGDLFAREIIGGMLDVEPDVIKRQGRWSRTDRRLEDFRKRWRKFDWTRVLTES